MFLDGVDYDEIEAERRELNAEAQAELDAERYAADQDHEEVAGD